MRTRNSSKSSKNEKSIKRKNLKRKRSITTDKPLKKGKKNSIKLEETLISKKIKLNDKGAIRVKISKTSNETFSKTNIVSPKRNISEESKDSLKNLSPKKSSIKNIILNQNEQESKLETSNIDKKKAEYKINDIIANYTAPAKKETLDILTDSKIHCREKDKEFILKHFNDSESKSLFLCGLPGTGKTSLMTEILEVDFKRNINFPFKIYLNCMSLHSIKDFIKEFFNYFTNEINMKIIKELFSHNQNLYNQILTILDNYEKEKDILNFLEKLSESKLNKSMTITILLDEIDHFYNGVNEIIFFEILSLPYLSKSNLKLIMISNNSEFDKFILPKIENRKISINKYIFQPYTHIEINKIITQKLLEMDYFKYFAENSVRFIASKTASKAGDIRPALEILKQLILSNDSEFKNGKIIELKDVLGILNLKQSQFVDSIKSMTFEQKIVVSSIYFVLNSSNNSNYIISEDEVLKQYKKIKTENFSNEINLRDYEEVIKSLLDLGIIIRQKSKVKNNFKVQPKMDEIQMIFGEDDRLFNMFKKTA